MKRKKRKTEREIHIELLHFVNQTNLISGMLFFGVASIGNRWNLVPLAILAGIGLIYQLVKVGKTK